MIFYYNFILYIQPKLTLTVGSTRSMAAHCRGVRLLVSSRITCSWKDIRVSHTYSGVANIFTVDHISIVVALTGAGCNCQTIVCLYSKTIICLLSSQGHIKWCGKLNLSLKHMLYNSNKTVLKKSIKWAMCNQIAYVTETVAAIQTPMCLIYVSITPTIKIYFKYWD